MPGKSELRVEVWDEDVVIDEYIGETVIDIESRWFDESYRRLENNHPIELRKLFNKATKQNIGEINMWVEIFEKGKFPNTAKSGQMVMRIPPPVQIKAFPEREFELRVIIWNVKKVPKVDSLGTTDIFVKVGLTSLNDSSLESTDIHKNAARKFVTKNAL